MWIATELDGFRYISIALKMPEKANEKRKVVITPCGC